MNNIESLVAISMNNELDHLIQRLKAIELKQEELLTEHRSILRHMVEIRAEDPHFVGPVISSRTDDQPTYLQGTQQTEPKRGGRVFITNLRAVSKRHKAAVITAAYSDRIELVLDVFSRYIFIQTNYRRM